MALKDNIICDAGRVQCMGKDYIDTQRLKTRLKLKTPTTFHNKFNIKVRPDLSSPAGFTPRADRPQFEGEYCYFNLPEGQNWTEVRLVICAHVSITDGSMFRMTSSTIPVWQIPSRLRN